MLPPDSKKPHKSADTTPDHVVSAAVLPEYAHPTAPPAAVTAPPSLGTLLHALRRCWWWALPVAAIVGGLAGLASLFVYPGSYTAVVSFRIAVRPQHGATEDEGAFSLVQQAQRAKLMSHEVLDEAIRSSGVSDKYGVSYTPQSLSKQLGTHFNSGPEIMYVLLSGENPEAITALLNAIGEAYPRKVAQEENARVEARIAELQRRLDKGGPRDPGRAPTIAEQLHDKRVELARVEKDAKLEEDGPLKDKYRQASDQQLSAQRALAARQLELIGAETKLSTLRSVPPRLPEISDAEVEDALGRSPRYSEAVEAIRDLKRQIEQAKKRYSRGALRDAITKPQANLEEWEEYLQLLIERTRQRLAEQAKKKAADDTQKAIADTRAELATLKSKWEQEKSEVEKWTRVVEEARVNAQRVPPNVLAVRDQLKQLEGEFKEVGGQVTSLKGSLPLPPRVTKLAEALVPTERDTARAQKIAIAVGLLAFMGIAAGLCLLEAMGKRVYSSSDVLTGLGMRIIGTLPRLPSSARKKSATAQALGGLDARYGLTEAIDAIRTVLMHSPRNDGARVILVTSAIGGEGKTTLASHLAASLARARRKTLLIDGDLRKPALNAQFDLPLKPGLSEALRGEIEFDDCIKPTMTSRLWLMPAGKVDGHSLQALAQDGLQNVFESLKDQFDFVVIDTSPVLLVPDGMLLAQQADTVVLSVMRDHSRIPAVYAAEQKLESLGIRVLGAVVIGEKTEAYGRAVPYPAATGV